MRLKRKGDWAENLALDYLTQAGLKLVERNYRCKQGEIDLVMQDGKDLVFVEVRYRNTQKFGGALSSVDWRKQKKIISTASQYLQTLRNTPPCRFDVIAIQDMQKIEWLKNAFNA